MCFLGKFSQDTPLELRLAMLRESEDLCRENLKGFQGLFPLFSEFLLCQPPPTLMRKETDSWILEWERYGQAAAAAAVMNYPATQPSGYDMSGNGCNAPAQFPPAYPAMQYTGPPVPNHQAYPELPVNGGGAMAPFQPAYPAMQYTASPVPDHQAHPGLPVNGGGVCAPNPRARESTQRSVLNALAKGESTPAANRQARREVRANRGSAQAVMAEVERTERERAEMERAEMERAKRAERAERKKAKMAERAKRANLRRLAERRDVEELPGKVKRVDGDEGEKGKGKENEDKGGGDSKGEERVGMDALHQGWRWANVKGKKNGGEGSSRGEKGKGKGKEKEADSGGNGEGLEDTDMDAVRRNLDWVDVDGEKNGGAGNSGGEKVKGKGTEKKVDSGYNAELDAEMDWFAVARGLEEWDVGEYGGHLTDDA